MNDFRDLIKEILWEKRSYQLSVAEKQMLPEVLFGLDQESLKINNTILESTETI